MKTVLLILFLLALPVILGYGVEKVYNSKQNRPLVEKLIYAFPSGSMVLLMVAGISNVAAIYLRWNLDKAVKMFAMALIIVVTICYCIIIGSRFLSVMKVLSKDDANDTKDGKESVNNGKKKPEISSALFFLGIVTTILLLVLVAQGRAYTTGDQTVETVNSFLASSDFFKINPLTGIPYTSGYPTRITLECLPFLYAVFAKTFDTASTTLVWNIMPVFWMINGMCCFWRIGRTIFNKKRDALVFYIVSLFLILCADKAFGAAGFSILHCAYRSYGVMILLVFNWTLSVVLMRKYWAGILGIIVEPLVIALQYGVGSCVAIVLITFILSRIPYFRKLGGGDNEAAE